jgi:hypothetical protein
VDGKYFCIKVRYRFRRPRLQLVEAHCIGGAFASTETVDGIRRAVSTVAGSRSPLSHPRYQRIAIVIDWRRGSSSSVFSKTDCQLGK